MSPNKRGPKRTKTATEQTPQPPEPKFRHRWDESGERCTICGDKDWMGGECSGPREQAPVSSSDVTSGEFTLGDSHHRSNPWRWIFGKEGHFLPWRVVAVTTTILLGLAYLFFGIWKFFR